MMRRTSINRRGKKVKAWDACRARLKKRFEAAGITTCEVCGTDSFLSFAHSKKRRHIQGDELSECALLCIPCHQIAEVLPHAEMAALIRNIIATRDVTI